MKRINGLFKRGKRPLEAPSTVLAPPPYIDYVHPNGYNWSAPLFTPKNIKKPVRPFPHQLPDELVQIIVDLYLKECRLSGDIRGISRLMRTSRSMQARLEPQLFRFITLNNNDGFTSFRQSLTAACHYTKAVEISYLSPFTVFHTVVLYLGHNLRKLCLASDQTIPSSPPLDSIFVHDITVYYGAHTSLGCLQCKRLRLSLTHADIALCGAPLIYNLPFSHLSWSPLSRTLTSLALELSSDDIGTLSSAHYNIFTSLEFAALRQLIIIIYFHTQHQLEEFRAHNYLVPGSPPNYFTCQVVYLLLEEHEEWTFRSLECREEDFWIKIRTRFECL
ncbi:hypothetical protein M408DRAFT_158369 [Serendipita vermifera MAFF 305830]|uniref:Uncharacterized protein n=1 Tax=Serendipita vermifera MAFF 305830 TaxID=933852 RepID=A0A0C2X6G2_SERVB|nr:hypothetical protein M408DRAFT_158369 [Serendipita vermifera MAFF 305830]